MKKLVLVCLIEAALAGYSVGAVAAPAHFTEEVTNGTVTGEIVSFDKTQSVSQKGIIKNGVVKNEGTIRVYNGGHAENTTIDTDGRFEVDEKGTTNKTTILNGGEMIVSAGIIRDTTVRNGGSLDLSLNSQSKGLLLIEKGADVGIDNNDNTGMDVSTNNPLSPANIYIEHAKLIGDLDIQSDWSGQPENNIAPTPSVPGPAFVTTIDKLEMAGGRLGMTTYQPAAQANRLEIKNLSGQGDFYISTQLAHSWGDFINVSQSATGKFGIEVEDTGKEPIKATPLNIIHVAAGDAEFKLLNKDSVVEVGAYQYHLVKEEKGESSDWVLQTQSGATSYSAKGVMAMAAAPRQVLQAESVSLQQRPGNYYSNPQHGYGLWTRYLHDDTRLNDKLNTSFKNKLDGVQIGVDKPFRLDDATVLVGVFTGFSRTKVSTDSYGSGTVESYHGGLYATYLHDNGFYADGMLKGNRLDNENNGRMKNGSSARGDYHQNAFTATIESGFNYEVVPALTVQPYGKLQYARIGSADYELNNGMRADVHSADSLQGEAGTLISTSFDVNSAVLKPYARLAIVHEFTKENDVTINRTKTVSNDFSGSTGKYGLGLDAQITPQAAFYTEINYLNGNKTETPLRADVGFRVRF
ncbi:autotransporter outer membrane beta-barrel domain-containing protein [Morganella psychrotolerans]|uniref:autotransporter outer membrane beta-barrel domain-containing protein n=1 Tax=Morganella psychrotolerans TaxID=368603 RepID=UPI0039B0DFBC